MIYLEKNNIFTEQKLIKFFESYIRSITLPSFVLYLKYGIGIEAHLQNTLLIFDDKFFVRSIVFRDLDNINYNPYVLREYFDLERFLLHPDTDLILHNDQFSLTRLYYSLVINNISELVRTLSKFYGFPQHLLWNIVSDIMLEICNHIESYIGGGPIYQNRLKDFKKQFFGQEVVIKAVLKMKLSNTDKFKICRIPNVLYK